MTLYGLRILIQSKMGLKPMVSSAFKKRMESKQSLSVEIMNNTNKRPLKELINNSNLELNLTS